MEVEEEPVGEGGCAGYLVLAILVAGAVTALYALSRTVFILAVWGLGWGAVIWVARKPLPDTAKPAPPPLPERGSEEEPQVSYVRDNGHPNRWVVARPSEWLGSDTTKAGTE